MTFRIAFGWRIFIYVICLITLSLGIWMISYLIININSSDFLSTPNFILIPISICLVSFSIYVFIRAQNEKVVILHDRYVVHYAFTIKNLLFDEIKGFTVDQNYIKLYPRTDTKKPINVSSSLDDKFTFIANLSSRYDDLDQINRIAEIKDLKSNIEYGKNETDREERLQKFKFVINVLNFFLIVFSLLLLAYPRPWDLLILLNLLLPILAVFLVFKSKGLVKLNSEQNSLYPHVSYVFMFPSMIVGLRLVIDIKFLTMGNFWIISIILTTILFIIINAVTNEIKFKSNVERFASLAFLFFTFAYSACWITFANVIGSLEEPVIYEVSVIDKEESESSYILELKGGWHPNANEGIDANVRRNFYRMVKKAI